MREFSKIYQDKDIYICMKIRQIKNINLLVFQPCILVIFSVLCELAVFYLSLLL